MWRFNAPIVCFHKYFEGGPKSTSVVDLGVSSILGQVGSLGFDGVLNLYSSIYDFKTHIPLVVILLFF